MLYDTLFSYTYDLQNELIQYKNTLVSVLGVGPIFHLRQKDSMFLFMLVCLLVCLSVPRITSNVKKRICMKHLPDVYFR